MTVARRKGVNSARICNAEEDARAETPRAPGTVVIRLPDWVRVGTLVRYRISPGSIERRCNIADISRLGGVTPSNGERFEVTDLVDGKRYPAPYFEKTNRRSGVTKTVHKA